MTPYQALFLLRLLELALMLVYAGWVATTPPSELRRIRGAVTWLLIFMNLAAVVMAVGWAKVTLW